MLAVAALALVGTGLFTHQLLARFAAAKRAALHKKLDDLIFDFSMWSGRLDRTLAGLRAIERLELDQSIAKDWTSRGVLLWVASTPDDRQSLAAAAQQVEALASSSISTFRNNPDAVGSEQKLKTPDIELVKRSLDRFATVDSQEAETHISQERRELLTAVRLFAKGDLITASALLREAARRNPADFWTLYWRFHCDQLRGLTERSVNVLTPCRALRPLSPELLFIQARANLLAGYYAEAERDADLLISRSFEPGETHRLRGVVRLHRDEARSAFSDFELAAANGADGPSLRMMAAIAAQQYGDRERAQAQWSKVEDLAPRSAQDWVALVCVRVRNGGPLQPGVDEALARLLEIEPANQFGLVWRGKLFLHDKHPQDAVALLEKHCQRGLNAPKLQAVIAQAYLDLKQTQKAGDAAIDVVQTGARTPALLLRAASILSRCSVAAQEPATQWEYANAAVHALQLVQFNKALSSKDLSDPDFLPLAQRPDFKALKTTPHATPLGPRLQLVPSGGDAMEQSLPDPR